MFLLLLGGAGLGVLGLLIPWRYPTRLRRAGAALAIGVAALLATPFAWALSPVLGLENVAFPAADIALLAPPEERPATPRWMRNQHPDMTRLLAYLRDNRGGASYLLATQTALVAAPIILEARAPVMAVGGYAGTDPILTPAALAALAETGRVRFFLLREAGRRNGGPPGSAREIQDWVKSHGHPIDPALWRPEPAGPQPGQYALYDLKARATASE